MPILALEDLSHDFLTWPRALKGYKVIYYLLQDAGWQLKSIIKFLHHCHRHKHIT
jgi:hypothetical protein